MNFRILLRGLLFLLSLVVVGLLLRQIGFGEIMDEAWIDREVRGHGFAGEALFVSVMAMGMAVGLPRQVAAFLGGYAFGFVGGALTALLATMLACVASFYYARLLGREMLGKRFLGRVARFDAFFAQHPFSTTLLIRLMPAGSNLLTNLVAGVTRVGARAFLAGSALGYVPQTAVFALAGSGAGLGPELHIVLAVLLFLASGLLGLYLYRRYRKGELDDSVD